MRAIDRAGNITDASNNRTIVELKITVGTIKVGDWVDYQVESGNGTTNGEYSISTASSSVQTFNINDYTGGWRVLYADKDSIEIVSDSSVVNLRIGGSDGYRYIKSTLTTIANHYVNKDYAISGRGMEVNASGEVSEAQALAAAGGTTGTLVMGHTTYQEQHTGCGTHTFYCVKTVSADGGIGRSGWIYRSGSSSCI